MCRSGTAYPVRILVLVQTALSLVFTYSLFPRLTPAGILVLVQTALSLVFTYSLFPRLTPAGILVLVQNTRIHCEPHQWRGNLLLSLRATSVAWQSSKSISHAFARTTSVLCYLFSNKKRGIRPVFYCILSSYTE